MTLLIAFKQGGKNYMATDQYIGWNSKFTGDRFISSKEKKVFKGKDYYVSCAGSGSVIDLCAIMAEERELVDTKKGVYEFLKEIIKRVKEDFYSSEVDFGGFIITKDNIRSFDRTHAITNRNYYALGAVDEVANYILHQNKGKVLKKLDHIFSYYSEVIDGVGRDYDLVSI